MTTARILTTLAVAAVLSTAALAAPIEQPAPVETHHSPTENLEHVDATLLATAKKRIDFAAYTFTSLPIVDALADAAKRGFKARVLLDPSQARQLQGAALDRLEEAARTANVEVRVKTGRDLMHLKSYSLDGTVLRTGSANFTASGLKRQNNDLIAIRDSRATTYFEVEFQAVFERGVKWEPETREQ